MSRSEESRIVEMNVVWHFALGLDGRMGSLIAPSKRLVNRDLICGLILDAAHGIPSSRLKASNRIELL